MEQSGAPGTVLHDSGQGDAFCNTSQLASRSSHCQEIAKAGKLRKLTSSDHSTNQLQDASLKYPGLNPSPSPIISSLPPDLLLKIFSNVPHEALDRRPLAQQHCPGILCAQSPSRSPASVRLVCKLWRELHDENVTELKLFGYKVPSPDPGLTLTNLLTKLPAVRCADFSHSGNVPCPALRSLPTTITSLALRYWNIEGPCVNHVLRVLTRLPLLTHLNFHHCNALKSSEFLQMLLAGLSAIPPLTSLTITGCALDQNCLSAVSELTQLTSLEVSLLGIPQKSPLWQPWNCTALPEGACKCLQHLTALNRLSLQDCYFTGSNVPALSALTGLTSLAVVCSQVSDEAVQVLTSLTNLERLSYEEYKEGGIGNEGLRWLASLLQLRQLELNGLNGIDERGVESLLQLTNLTHLELLRCRNITATAMETLSRHASLGDNAIVLELHPLAQLTYTQFFFAPFDDDDEFVSQSGSSEGDSDFELELMGEAGWGSGSDGELGEFDWQQDNWWW